VGGAVKDSDLVIFAAHGILTRKTSPAWNDHFEAYIHGRHNGVAVEKARYFGGPFPAWNVWVKNYQIAREAAARLEPLLRLGARPALVGHSNGADIILKMARHLARQGVHIEAVVCIGGACEQDVSKNGILTLMQSGFLRRAVCYANTGDLAVKSPLIWPYGNAGFTGWTLGEDRIETGRIFTRWFPAKVGHSGYYLGAQRDETFELIYRDCMGIEDDFGRAI
jgi:pimeloyl-ACP methyl ester carboxylesterase